MRYKSTRGKAPDVDAFQALLCGLAPDGGLYIPESVPRFTKKELDEFLPLQYDALAYAVLSPYFPIPEKIFRQILAEVYSPGRFLSSNPAPLHNWEKGAWVLSLDQGPTLAFKDMALQLLPRLLTYALSATGESRKLLILAATSGDTGKAALEGFRDIPSTRAAVVYPRDGVSLSQKRQMITQGGKNIWVRGIEGNFDDAQAQVKLAMTDSDFLASVKARGWLLSSANSINIGRLLPQIVYYFHAYLALVRKNIISIGQAVNFCVPTGNFGDILAGWFAAQMGIPIGRLICASNRNHVLTDFFSTGKYDVRRPFHATTSPSMDILVSSNLERLLTLLSESPESVSIWMSSLSEKGYYEVPELLPELRRSFSAGYAQDEAVATEIRRSWKQNNCLIDPHTAVGCSVYQSLREDTPTVILATASPFKFSGTVLSALQQPVPEDDVLAAKELSLFTGISLPEPIRDLEDAPILHNEVIPPESLREELLAWLEV
ncbi:MAG: threonine synthase [Christensenellales bacterium]|jgi:threonine synthase